MYALGCNGVALVLDSHLTAASTMLMIAKLMVMGAICRKMMLSSMMPWNRSQAFTQLALFGKELADFFRDKQYLLACRGGLCLPLTIVDCKISQITSNDLLHHNGRVAWLFCRKQTGSKPVFYFIVAHRKNS